MAEATARQGRLEEALRRRMSKSRASRAKATAVLTKLQEDIKALLEDVSAALHAVLGLRKCQVISKSDLDNLTLDERLQCESGYLEIVVKYSMERERDKYIAYVASEFTDNEEFDEDYFFWADDEEGKMMAWIEETVIEALMLEKYY